MLQAIGSKSPKAAVDTGQACDSSPDGKKVLPRGRRLIERHHLSGKFEKQEISVPCVRGMFKICEPLYGVGAACKKIQEEGLPSVQKYKSIWDVLD